MQGLFQKYKKIILFAAIGLGVIFVGSTVMNMLGSSGTGSNTQASPVSSGNQVSGQMAVEQEELARELAFLKTITFDSSFFTSPLFTSLVDFSQTIPQEPVGRLNPFAPIDNSRQRVDISAPNKAATTSTSSATST